MYTAHFPRLHPSDFRVKSLDGVADDWPIDYDTLAPFFEENDRMMGVSGLAGDPAVPPRNPPMPPLPLGRSGAMLRQGDEPARLALVAVRHHGRDDRLRGPRALHQSRPLHAGLRAGREGEHRHHLLAAWRSAPASSCARIAGCARSPPTSTAWPSGVVYYDADGNEQFQAGACRRARLQRRRHAAAAAELGLGQVSRTGSPIRAGWSART